ncbi:CLUMA_CG005562, isoform A, partial [Clunio marinus]
DDINFVNIIDYTSNSYKSQKPTTSRRAEDEIRSLKRQLARIQDEFRRIKSPSGTFNRGLTISKMKIPRDISFVPPPINDVKDLDRFEEQLKKYNKNPSLVDREFTILREKLVNYYSKKIYNQEVRTSPKNALAASFMKMYFADEFQNRIGWTEYENRVPLKKYSGHIMFVFDIVNKRRPETYATYEDAAAAIYNYQRRYHESINALKRVKKTDAL